MVTVIAVFLIAMIVVWSCLAAVAVWVYFGEYWRQWRDGRRLRWGGRR